MSNYMKDWDYIRMWTFTLSSRISPDIGEHLHLLNKVWRYFITELRRNKLFTKGEQQTQFVRVIEPHISGYFHYHCFFDRYVRHSQVLAAWYYAVNIVTGFPGISGGCHVKARYGHKLAASYVTKYVTKSCHEMTYGARIWSKSARVAIFLKRKNNGQFVVYNTVTDEWLGCRGYYPLLESSIAQLHADCYQLCLFVLKEEPNIGYYPE